MPTLPTAAELIAVPPEALLQAKILLPVYLTPDLWDAFIEPPPTAVEQQRGARMALLLLVLRAVLGGVPPGREHAAFSFQVKNRPLHWDTLHAWVAVRVEQPDGLPALVVGLERLETAGES